jgi:hypothetical protein
MSNQSKFLAAANELAKSAGIPIGAARNIIARKSPELYAEHKISLKPAEKPK